MDSDSDSDYECMHESTIKTENSIIVCKDCGLNLEEDSLVDNENVYYGASDTRYSSNPTRHHYRKEIERTLYADLEKLGFPKEIIERANDYYKEIIKNNIYRAKNRSAIIFGCVFRVYKDINEPRTPNDLATIFKINKKIMSKGLKIFSSVFPDIPQKEISPVDLIPKLLNDLGVNKSIASIYYDDIILIYNFVEKRSILFKQSNPQSVAAGIVYCYLKLKKIDITKKDYSKIVKLTDITFTKIAKNTGEIIGQKIRC